MTMTETRSTAFINESIASLCITTNHHAHSLQEIMKQLNANTEQLNAISIVLQKLTEAEEKRQQPSSPKTPLSQVVSLPLQSLAKSVRLEFPRFRGDDPVT